MDRRLGRPLPHQLANPPRAHLTPPEIFTLLHAKLCAYAVLAVVSNCCPPVQGRLPTRYSPVRHSVTSSIHRSLNRKRFVRLACVNHAASVHPEPGSNSLIKCSSVCDGIYHSTDKFDLVKITTWLSFPFTVFKGQFLKINSLRIFSRLFHCSVINVLNSFSLF